MNTPIKKYIAGEFIEIKESLFEYFVGEVNLYNKVIKSKWLKAFEVNNLSSVGEDLYELYLDSIAETLYFESDKYSVFSAIESLIISEYIGTYSYFNYSFVVNFIEGDFGIKFSDYPNIDIELNFTEQFTILALHSRFCKWLINKSYIEKSSEAYEFSKNFTYDFAWSLQFLTTQKIR